MRSAVVFSVMIAAAIPAADADQRVYELRTYTASPGKLGALNARFRDHTCKLFEKHGMTNVGYWMPIDNKDTKLIYLLSHSSKAAADKSWAAFVADPAWKKALADSEVNGKLAANIERQFLSATDYSPQVENPTGGEHVFELRTYTAAPGRLDALSARFRNHTMKLFEKHGMVNLGYWTPSAGGAGADNTLVYILVHKNADAAKKSFDAFRADPAWKAAKNASEEKAGGSLTVTGGVKSVFMKPTDYSPMK